MKSSSKWLIAILLYDLSLLILFLIVRACNDGAETQKEVATDTTTITIYDTVTYKQPIAVDSVVVRYKTVKVKKIVTDTLQVVDTLLVNDSVLVELPITQKEYKDSTYNAWVSGYEPNLDSIKVYPKTVYNTITNTITIKEKPKRWGIGVQGGYGYGIGGFTPYIGVGVHYNIFSW